MSSYAGGLSTARTAVQTGLAAFIPQTHELFFNEQYIWWSIQVPLGPSETNIHSDEDPIDLSTFQQETSVHLQHSRAMRTSATAYTTSSRGE